MSARFINNLTAPRQLRYIDLARYIKANAPDVVKGVSEIQLCDELESCFTKRGCLAFYYVTPNGELGGVLTGYIVSPTVVHISLIIATHPFAVRNIRDWLASNFGVYSIRSFRRNKLVYYPNCQQLLKKFEQLNNI